MQAQLADRGLKATADFQVPAHLPIGAKKNSK